MPTAQRSEARTPGSRVARARGETPQVVYHRDGSIWAKGKMRDGEATGYWEWFRRDGTRLRSGYFENGRQTGQWTTYDKTGAVYKVTTVRPTAASPANAPKRGRPRSPAD